MRTSVAGRLVRVGQGEIVYKAFVPNPLPPALTFDLEMVRKLSEADRALGELAGLGRTLPSPHLLIGPFMRREAVLSSRIEGTEADIVDLYAYEAGQLPLPGFRPSPPDSDVREVLNYVHALEYGLQRLDTLPVSLRLIREVHTLLMRGVRGEHATPGEFRTRQNWIGPPGCVLNEARFVPPPVPEMHQALDAFEKYLYAPVDYPPLMRLALIHYQFEAIHPFVDGNGRLGRLLLLLLLVHWNLIPLPLLYLGAYFERHRSAYYDHLLAVSEHNAWREWVLFFLDGVAIESLDAVRRARQLQELREEWRDRLSRIGASGRTIRLADSLFESPFITVGAAQRLLDVTYGGASKIVATLVHVGILAQVGERSYNKVFTAREILPIIGAEAGLFPAE